LQLTPVKRPLLKIFNFQRIKINKSKNHLNQNSSFLLKIINWHLNKEIFFQENKIDRFYFKKIIFL
jgi:hypothetical protein